MYPAYSGDMNLAILTQSFEIADWNNCSIHIMDAYNNSKTLLRSPVILLQLGRQPVLFQHK